MPNPRHLSPTPPPTPLPPYPLPSRPTTPPCPSHPTPSFRGPPGIVDRGCRSTRRCRFFPRLSLFLKHFVLPVRVCFSARARADFHTSRDRFQLFEALCSSINSERVIGYEPLLYSKTTIRVLRTATAVPTPHIADAGEKLISTATGRTGFCIPY